MSIIIIDKKSATNAKVTVDDNHQITFSLKSADPKLQYETSPTPVEVNGTGAESIESGTYDFSGTTTYTSARGGLDQTKLFDINIIKNAVIISFFDDQHKGVGVFVQEHSLMPTSSSYRGSGKCQWIQVPSFVSNFSSGKWFDKNSETKAEVRITVGNKLDFYLALSDCAYETSPKLVNTTGIGAIQLGTYEFGGVTWYDDLQGGLDQTNRCTVAVNSSIVTITFYDPANNPVGIFHGRSAMPSGSKYNGDGLDGSVAWVEKASKLVNGSESK